MRAVLVGLVLLFASPAFGAIAHDATSNSGTKSAASSTSGYSHTAGTLTNGVAIIRLSFRDATGTLSGITYCGSAATAIEAPYTQDGGNGIRTALYIYKNPASGSCAVVATFSEVVDTHIVSVSTYSGVDQATSTGTVAKATTAGAGTSPATVNVTSAVGELVVDVADALAGATTFTVHASQTQRVNVAGGGGTYGFHAGSEEAGAASVTMSWTLGVNDRWSIIGVSLKPASERRATPPILLSFLWSFFTPYEAHACYGC